MAVLDWLQQMLGGGDPEAQGQATASMAMQPVVGSYLRDVVTGEVARRGLESMMPMDVALGFTGGGLGTKIFRGSGSGPGAGWFGTQAPYGMTESGAPGVLTWLETDRLSHDAKVAKANWNLLPGKGMRAISEPTPYDLAVARQRWLRGLGNYGIIGPVAGVGLLGTDQQ